MERRPYTPTPIEIKETREALHKEFDRLETLFPKEIKPPVEQPQIQNENIRHI